MRFSELELTKRNKNNAVLVVVVVVAARLRSSLYRPSKGCRRMKEDCRTQLLKKGVPLEVSFEGTIMPRGFIRERHDFIRDSLLLLLLLLLVFFFFFLKPPRIQWPFIIMLPPLPRPRIMYNYISESGASFAGGRLEGSQASRDKSTYLGIHREE